MATTMDLSKYLDLFVCETREHLAAIEEDLARLEESPTDEAIVQELYRHAHSIKGMAASMGYPGISELAHAIESVFDAIKRGERTFDGAVRSAVARAFDHVGRMVSRVEDGEAPGEDAGPFLAGLVSLGAGALRLPRRPAPDERAGPAPARRLAIEVRVAREAPLASARAAVALKRLKAHGRIVSYAPSLASLEGGEFEGLLSAEIMSSDPPESIRRTLENLADIETASVSWVEPAGSIETAEPAATLGQLPPDGSAAASGRPGAVETGIALADRLAPILHAPMADDGGDPSQAAQGGERAAPGATTPYGTLPAPGARPRPTLRISAEKLDRFLETLGELVVHRSRLEARVRGRVDRETDLDLERLRKLTRRLHGDVLALRVLPFDTIAHRFVRSVREMASSLGKRASLRITGRDVLLDRSVLDELVDPINHVLRNALDHGLEAPEERLVAGKPEGAIVTVSVERGGDTVVIRIEDDGRGMDVEKIKSTALDRGLVSREALREMSDGEALMLATIPGISTAGSVTDLSGRGVGMDVVRTRVEALGGRLVLSSSPGAGTAVEFRLPITIVVVPAFLVESGGRKWAAPVATVERTVQFLPDKVLRVDGRDYFITRSGRIPLFDLPAVLGLSKGSVPYAHAEHVLIAHEGDRSIAVAVERIVGRREIVVTPLKAPLEELRPYSGATLMEDGRIALLLDLLNLSGV